MSNLERWISEYVIGYLIIFIPGLLFILFIKIIIAAFLILALIIGSHPQNGTIQ